MKVALVHDWLTTYAGAEKVFEQIIRLYPHADLYSVVDFLPKHQRQFLKNKKVNTSFIQKLPMASRYYRQFLPLMPLAVEQFNLSAYDLIISDSSAVAKGVITGPGQMHISYIHSPMRYAWDMQHQYLVDHKLTHGVKGMIAKFILHKLRIWDASTANGVDHFVTNSEFVAERIKKIYRRESTVIHPPVDLDRFQCWHDKLPGTYFAMSRMVPYKKLDLIIKAFNEMPDKELVVMGDGPEFKNLKNMARGNVKVLQYDATAVSTLMKCSSAFVFAGIEDFGITMAEAQACGTPVIAFNKGGAKEIVTNDTGLLFNQQTADGIIGAIQEFEKRRYEPGWCAYNARRFSKERFRREFSALVEEAIQGRWGEKQETQRLAAPVFKIEPGDSLD